jgi:hypothetical protein
MAYVRRLGLQAPLLPPACPSCSELADEVRKKVCVQYIYYPLFPSDRAKLASALPPRKHASCSRKKDNKYDK